MNKSQTKRALLMSVISMLLCCTMLIGTTFAWFTDSVESGINTIVAGNLDVELYHTDDEASNEKVLPDTKLFELGNWEPGVVAYENLTVQNEGTLALQYQLSVKAQNATVVNGHSLTEALKVAVVEGGFKATDRAALLAEVEADENAEWMNLASFAETGKLYAEENAEADEHTAVTYGIVIWWEPTENDNVFNMNNENKGQILSVDLGVELFATQLEAESDSFGKDYDKDAFKFDGKLDDYVETVPDADEPEKVTKIVIHNATGLMAFAEKFGTDETKDITTVEIAADIDLAGCEWQPINAWDPENSTRLTIEGQGHTISNMTVEGGSQLGFIGKNARDITINDLTFDGAAVTTSGSQAAVVIGYQYGDVVLNNVDVKNSTVKTTAEKGIRLGGLVGQSFLQDGATLTVTGCDVDGFKVTGYHNVAGLVGSLMNYSTLTEKWEITNSTVKNSDFVVTSTSASNASYFSAVACEGGNYGATNAYINDGVNFSGVTTENNTFDYTQELVKGGLYYDGETYAVESAAGFVYLTNMISDDFSGNVALAADIDLGIATVADDAETWKTIKSFAGTFDGQGYTISNLKDAALFNTISGEVKNLNLKGVTATDKTQFASFAHTVSGKVTNCNVSDVNITVTFANHGGAVAGFVQTVAEGAVIDGCKVSNVTINLTDASKNCSDGEGGVIGGVATGATVQNCEFTNITLSAAGKIKRGGGIFGSVSGKVTGCVVNDVTVKTTWSTDQAGGFAGIVNGGAEITDVILNNVNLDIVYGNNLGGLFGKVGIAGQSNITLKNITTNGLKMKVVEYTQNVGGFIGQVDYRTNDSRLTVDNCHINGLDMTLASDSKTGESPVAGFISCINGGADITNCSVDGKIDGTNELLGIGGFLGDIGGYGAKNAYTVNITGCKADVAITGNESIMVGGFVAYAGSYRQTNTHTLNFTNCEAKGSFYGAIDANETSTFTGCKVDGADFAG